MVKDIRDWLRLSECRMVRGLLPIKGHRTGMRPPPRGNDIREARSQLHSAPRARPTATTAKTEWRTRCEVGNDKLEPQNGLYSRPCGLCFMRRFASCCTG